MKKYNQGGAFRIIYSALTLVLGWLFAYYVATLVCSTVNLALVEWLSVTGAAVCLALIAWVIATLRLHVYSLSVEEERLVLCRSLQRKTVAIGDIIAVKRRTLAFGRTLLCLRTQTKAYWAIIRTADVGEVIAQLPAIATAEEAACLTFKNAEKLNTLWIGLLLCVIGLTVAVVLVIPVCWAFFSREAAMLALKVLLIAFGVAAAVTGIAFGVRESVYSGYRLEFDGEALRRVTKHGVDELAVKDVKAIVVKQNVAAVLFGRKRVKLCTRADANTTEANYLPYYITQEELEFLKKQLSLQVGDEGENHKTDVLPLAATMLIYFVPVILCVIMFHWTFAIWLVPGLAVIANNCLTKRVLVGEICCFAHGYFGTTTVIFRTDSVCKIDTAAGFAAKLFRKVNLKVYLPGVTNVFYTGCTLRAYYKKIEQILQKKVDIAK